MVMEWTYRQLQKAVAHGNTGKDEALFLLLDAVPCILHMENRVGLKIIKMLLVEGLGNAMEGKIMAAGDGVLARVATFFDKVEEIANKSIWGSSENPSQWDCPRGETENSIGILCLDNNSRSCIFLSMFAFPQAEIGSRRGFGAFKSTMRLWNW